MRVEDQGGKRGCSDPKYCQNGKPKSADELAKMRNQKKSKGGGEQDDRLKIFGGEYTFGGYGKNLVSWDGEKEIDPAEWEALLSHIGSDVNNFSTGWYDTPFFDGFGALSGTGCINGECSDRSEINYIGEGEALAALGLTKKQTFYVVAIWKHLIYDEAPSPDTFKFAGIGWDYYDDHYSTP